MEYEWEVTCITSRTTIGSGITDDLETAKQAAEEVYSQNIDRLVGKYALYVDTDFDSWARYRTTEWHELKIYGG